jgi:hypothetical protein
MSIVTNNIYNADPKVLEVLELIAKKLNNMATKQELLAIATEIKASLGNLGDDITRLTDKVESGDVGDDVIAEFRGIADQIKSLADRTPEEGTESPATPAE